MRRRNKSSAWPPLDTLRSCARYSNLSEPRRAVSSSRSARVAIQRRHNCTNTFGRDRCVRRSENARITPSSDRSWVADKSIAWHCAQWTRTKVRPRCAAGDWARTGQLANESAHRDDEPWDATKRFLYHLICPGRGVRPFAGENREIGSANAHVTGDAFHLGRTAPVKVHHRPASAVPASPPMRKQATKARPFAGLSRAGHSSLHADSSVALLRVEPTQRRAVAQQDPAPLWHLDRRRILQMLERARYGLDGEAEIVSDILTRHRQLDGPAAGHALRHFQQKARNPLLRALDQHQRMLLHTSQFAGGQLPHLAGDIIVPCRKRHHRAAFDHDNLAVGDRFRRKRVLVSGLETENVAGQMEGSDLTAPVHQDLVGAHRSTDDLVEVFGWLVLAVDLGVGGKRHARAHELDRTGLRGTGKRDAMRLRCRLPLGN